MKPIYSKAGLARLDEIVQPGLLCAFDFDGTLAPIVRQPVQAQVPPQVLRALIALANHTPVAIVTGRSPGDARMRLKLKPILDFEPTYLVGNHGLEGSPGGDPHAARYEEICQIWMKTLRASIQRETNFASGVQIEDKRYSLSLHYRLAPDHTLAAMQLERLCKSLDPVPRIVPGKCVINLLPQGAPNKGTTVEKLMQLSDARRAVYVGDDITDEDVFSLPRQDLLSIRIENAENSAAPFFLNHQMEILHFLEELTRRLRTQQAKNPMHTATRDQGCACGVDGVDVPLSTKA